jgi:hypothetical protein
MAVASEQLLEPPLLELRMCPACLRFVPLSHTDIRKNQIVRIFTNACAVGNSPIRRRPIISKSP